jgi:DNA-binding MarR family transcriptional regulator
MNHSLLQSLADFRYRLRQFLHFSEQAAQKFDLSPRQHQFLLQVAGVPDDTLPTIAYVAERLGIRHNSAAELTDRCVEEDLVERTQDAEDKRRVLLRVTPRGRRILHQLSGYHARELNELGPALVASLKRLSELESQQRDDMQPR